MARLATIQSYLIEIRKLHREGDNLATTILAKLLASLDERLTRAKQHSLHFTRSFTARPVYDADFVYNEFSAVWIAFASYYHTIAFHDNDTLKANFHVIWTTYFKHYGEIAPDICNADFFRKCLIAAELYRRKQYANHVKKLLSADTILQYKDQIKALPSFPLPNDLLPLITDRLFTSMINETTSFHYLETANGKVIPEMLCHFSILNNSIQIYIDRALQFLLSYSYQSVSRQCCAPIVILFLEMQSELPGGIPLTLKQQQMIEINRRLNQSYWLSLAHRQEKKAISFSTPDVSTYQPSESDILTSLSTIHTRVDPDQQYKAYAMLDEHFIPPNLLPLVIENLLRAANTPSNYICEAAYDKLRKLPIPAHLNNRVIETLLGEKGPRNMSEYKTKLTPFLGRTIITADILPMVVDYLLDHIKHGQCSTLATAAGDVLININMRPELTKHAISRLIAIGGEPSQLRMRIPSFVSYRCSTRFIRLLATLLTRPNIPDELKDDVAIYIIEKSALLSTCDNLIVAFKLLGDITTDQLKSKVLTRVIKELCLTRYDAVATVCASIFDKLTPSTYEARYKIVTKVLPHMHKHSPVHHMVKPLLALTSSLPFEHQVRMMTLFEEILGDDAFIINDCILGRFKLQEQVNEQVIRPMYAVLPSDMITAIETLAYPRL